jgi:aspartokinase
MVDLTKVFKEYIDSHPAIQQCIKDNLIDFSNLAKHIAKEKNLDEKEVLIVISHLYPYEKEEEKESIRAILKESKIETKSKIATLIAKNDWHILLKVERVIDRMLQVVRGSTCITLVMDESWLAEVKNLLEGDVIDSERGLAEISIISPKEIESTPGVVSYFYDALASKGINVVETLSCYTDTMFLVKDKDLFPAYQALNQLLVGTWLE